MKLHSTLSLALRKTLAPFGLRAIKTTPNKVRGIDPLLDLRYLIQHKAAPVIFDIGANEGETVTEFSRHFPDARIFAFEPFDACFQALKVKFQSRPKITVENLALGETAGTAQLNTFSGSNMNSLLQFDRQEENVLKDFFSPTGNAAVRLDTVDAYCSRNGIAHIDILKTDTQGYDLHVLKGASGMLQQQRITTLLLEVNFIPMYKNQARFHDLHEFLSSHGYRLVDFYNQEQPNGYTAWCDACYIATSATATLSDTGR